MKRIFVIVLLVMTAVTAAALPKPVISLDHKYQKEYNASMRLDRLRGVFRIFPAKLKKEITQEYYPALRESLHQSDTTTFKKAQVSIERRTDELFDVTMDFPKYVLTIKDASWEELDNFFYRDLKTRKD